MYTSPIPGGIRLFDAAFDADNRHEVSVLIEKLRIRIIDQRPVREYREDDRSMPCRRFNQIAAEKRFPSGEKNKRDPKLLCLQKNILPVGNAQRFRSRRSLAAHTRRSRITARTVEIAGRRDARDKKNQYIRI